MQDMEAEERVICIPREVLKANYDRRGYFDRYRRHYREITGGRYQRGAGKLAWEALESELARYCLPCQYSTYESFRVARSCYLRRILGRPLRNPM